MQTVHCWAMLNIIIGVSHRNTYQVHTINDIVPFFSNRSVRFNDEKFSSVFFLRFSSSCWWAHWIESNGWLSVTWKHWYLITLLKWILIGILRILQNTATTLQVARNVAFYPNTIHKRNGFIPAAHNQYILLVLMNAIVSFRTQR